MGDVGIVGAIGSAIGAALEPLIDTFSYEPARRELIIALELEPRDDVGVLSLAELDAAAAKLRAFEDAAAAMEAITAAIVAVEQVVRLMVVADDTDDLQEIALRALELAGASRLRQRSPLLFALARLIGVLTDDLLRIDWDRFGEVLRRLLVPQPPGEPNPADDAGVLSAVLLQAWIAYMSVLLAKGFGIDEIEWLYGWDPDPTILDDPAQQISERTLTLALRETGLHSETSSEGVAAELLLSSAFLPPAHRGPAIMLGLGGALEIEWGADDVDPATSRPVRPPGTRLRVAAPSGATILLPLPGSQLSFRLDGGPQGPASVLFDLRRPPSDTKIVFPDDTRRRWEIGSIAFAGGLVAQDLSLELTIGDAALVIDPKPEQGKRAEPGSELLRGPDRYPFTFSVGWTASRGVYISGGTALGITVPTPWAKLGGLRVHHVRLELVPPGGPAGRALGVDATISASLDIGSCFHATVDRIGARLKVDLSDGADFGADFISPSAIGLLIVSKPVKGGGTLLLDRDRGQYAGAFEVALDLERVGMTLQAIVVYTTQLEGGGSALLASLSVQDFRWDLGWGFALTGLGGMIGANHGVDLVALRDGLRTGALEHVMFPTDPVRNAGRIFQTLRTVFPIERGSTIAALFFELSWGRDLALIRLGVLGHWRAGADDDQLILLGSVDLVAPLRQLEVLRIKADLLGVVKWTDGIEISVDAQLRDSELLGVALTGSLALRLRRSATDPMFLLSIGGFHPQFPLPPATEVPRLDRLGFRLEKGAVRISAEVYFAIAACTVQAGMRIDLTARGLGLRVEATVGFDVIVDATTWDYVAEIYGRAALKRGSSTLMGLDIYCRLEGSSPSRFSGKVTFKIWFIKKTISWSEPLRGGDRPQVPLVDAGALLAAELASPRNWNGALPPDGRRLVSIDPVTGDGDGVVVHPLGELGVRQRLLPLGLDLDRIGAARPSGERRFAITRVSGIGDGAPLEDVSDQFAVAQFLELDEAAVLSQPGFEAMPSGVRVRSDAITAGVGRRRPLRYETIVIPQDHRPQRPSPRPPRGRLEFLEQFSALAATTRVVAPTAAGFGSAPERRVVVRADRWVVVGEDLSALDGAPRRSFHIARQQLAAAGTAGAAVVEAHEVRT